MMTSDTTLGAVSSALGPPPGEVDGVRGVVWVGGPSHLDMSLDGRRCRINEMDLPSLLGDPREHPLPCAMVGEVPVLDPSRVLVRVSASVTLHAPRQNSLQGPWHESPRPRGDTLFRSERPLIENGNGTPPGRPGRASKREKRSVQLVAGYLASLQAIWRKPLPRNVQRERKIGAIGLAT